MSTSLFETFEVSKVKIFFKIWKQKIFLSNLLSSCFNATHPLTSTISPQKSCFVSLCSSLLYNLTIIIFAGGNRKLEKRPWTEEEKRVVFEFFEDNIIRCKLPGKRDIDECLRKNEVLQTRSWRNIKDCIRNKIVSKKGKLFYNKNTSI